MTIEANGKQTTAEKFIEDNGKLLGKHAIERINNLHYVGAKCIVYIYLSEIRIERI